jgi:hypothetical protein
MGRKNGKVGLMAIKSRSAKNKGKKFQNQICADLSDLSKIPWGEDELIASRGMGQHGVDIILIGKALELLPFSFEAKNHEKWNVGEDIKQAICNKKEGTVWCVLYKKNRKVPIFILEKESFYEIFSSKTRKMFFTTKTDRTLFKNVSLQKWLYAKDFKKTDIIFFLKNDIYCVAGLWETFLKAYKKELKGKGLL